MLISALSLHKSEFKMKSKTITKNKKAFHDYQILDQIEAGIILNGNEVKSAKNNQIQIKGSYISMRKNEPWLVGAHIAYYQKQGEHDEKRDRKLLLGRKEIMHILGKSKSEGVTLVPLDVHLRKGFIKINIGIARGKKKYDKRQAIKKKEQTREAARAMKRSK